MATLGYHQVAAATITVANTQQSFYTVPAATAVIGQLIANNNSTTVNLTFRIAVVSGGGSPSAQHWIAYDVPLTPGESYCFSGLTLGAADQVWIQSSATSSSVGTGIIFQLYGEVQT